MRILEKKFFDKPKILFSILAVLALGQVLWWTYLLIHQQDLIMYLDPTETEKGLRFKRMVLFESIFFIFFWSLGLYYTFKSFKQHQRLRNTHNLFLSGVSHELKTPIADMMLSLDTLQREDLDNQKRSQYLVKAQKTLVSLYEEIETLLAVTHLEKSYDQKTEVAIKPLVQTILRSYFAKNKASESDFDISISDDDSVFDSPIALNIIFKNLIDNSIKYTKKTTPRKIKIKSQKGFDFFSFEITDNGIGMTEDEIKRCSEAFWRSDRVVEEAFSGTGMGMTLIHEIAVRSGIDLNISSEGINKGLRIQLVWR